MKDSTKEVIKKVATEVAIDALGLAVGTVLLGAEVVGGVLFASLFF